MSTLELSTNQKAWNRKPVLRELYRGWYRKIDAFVGEGLSLEIGGGFGNYKSLHPETVVTDIVCGAQVDTIADGQQLPFRDGAFKNIILVDVLHHLEHPAKFFFEAQRVLSVGGRICLIEPLVTPFSWLIYRFFHKEKLVLNPDINSAFPMGITGEPFDGNLACINVLFGKRYRNFMNMQMQLQVSHFEPFCYFAYPLSGGFSGPQLYPGWLLGPILFVENMLRPFRWLLSCRAFIVLKKIEKLPNSIPSLRKERNVQSNTFLHSPVFAWTGTCPPGYIVLVAFICHIVTRLSIWICRAYSGFGS